MPSNCIPDGDQKLFSELNMPKKLIRGVRPMIFEPLVKWDAKYWEQRRRTRIKQWHIEMVHPQLTRYLFPLTQFDVNRHPERKLKFFMPLCGKSKDIPFLLSRGYEVFGVVSVTSFIDEFIEQCRIDLTYDARRNLFHNQDETLQLYSGDLFKCPIEKYGPFDCIWDRASFIALNYPLRAAYIEMMKKAVAYGAERKHDFRYLLQTVFYDKTKPGDPPHCVDAQDMKEFYEGWSKVTKLESNWAPYDHPMRRAANYFDEDFFEEFYMIEPKL